MKNITSLLILFLFSGFTLIAQEIEIKGKITTYGEIPVVNADVIVQSSEQIVKTDEKGEFTCTCQLKDKLSFIANGFIKQSYKIKKKHDGIVNVDLKLSTKPGSEDKAIKAAHILELEKFRELVKLGPDYKDYSRYNTLLDALKNEFPSLIVSHDEILIRGVSSIQLSNSAGIEVDGVEVGLGMLKSLNPDNIASIKVIKGSEASRYGTRGTNGMIVIKTK
jgi:hypothetical protein